MQPQFGAYGKIPELGDFLRIGLGPDLARSLDGWLQRSLTSAQRTLGPRWDSCYMKAPIWRFTLPPAVLCRGAALGVVMPSVDRVGRKFPLVLVAELPGVSSPLGLHLAAEGCFAALEDLALLSLEDGTDRMTLAGHLVALPVPVATHKVQIARHGALLLGQAQRGGEADGGLGLVLAADLAGHLPRGTGLWSCVSGAGRRVLMVPGLPEDQQAALLFDPDHAHWARLSASGGPG